MPMLAQAIESGQEPGLRVQFGYELPHGNCYGFFG